MKRCRPPNRRWLALKRMGFMLDGLDAEAYDRTYADREVVARVLKYFQRQRLRVLLGVVSIVASAAA